MSHHLAIAGAWGYIGRKFVDAGHALGRQVSVLDPAPAPEDLDVTRLRRLAGAAEFCGCGADLYHLALHPEHRRETLDGLLQRARGEPLAILNEKPMAAPERPDDCALLIDALTCSQALLLFDFPELFDPVTARILEHLRRFDRVDIDHIDIQRSKDREDPTNPRNTKRMVHIQYQESVHCLAWVLFLLAHIHGDADETRGAPIRVSATSQPYRPPNPQAYPYVVDGRVDYDLRLGSTQVRGRTDFTRGAEWAKRRRLVGRGDGRPLVIEVDYLEGAKRLVIDGVDQSVDADGSSYTGVLVTYDRWQRQVARPELMHSCSYPNAAFAHRTYQLSSLLWRCCYDGEERLVDSMDELLRFDAGFAEAAESFARYPA